MTCFAKQKKKKTPNFQRLLWSLKKAKLQRQRSIRKSVRKNKWQIKKNDLNIRKCYLYWFCGLHDYEFFCEVDEDSIQDKFNLSQLNEQVPHCRQALDMILDLEPDEELEDNPNQRTLIKQSAKMLYGFTQTTYILTNHGTTQMLEKYQQGEFGYCPTCTVRTSQCFPIAFLTPQVRPWWSSTAPSAWTIPHLRHHRGSTTQKAPTWVPVSLTLLFMVHAECRPKQPTNQFMSKVYSCKIHPLSYQVQFQAASNFESVKTIHLFPTPPVTLSLTVPVLPCHL